MGCAAGYPDKPCPFGYVGGVVTRKSCGPCKNFIPPAHILAWCKLWDREQKLCMKPKSDCGTCPERNQRPVGHPPTGKIDWTNPADVRKYQAELMRERRAQGIHNEKPHTKEYHQAYYAKNKERILERRRARRQAMSESGGSEV